VPETVIDDVRTLDPVSYIRQLRLRPEDSYGFVPMRLDEGSALLYLYRDRPEYEAARPQLPPPAEAQQFGPIRIEPTQTVEMQAPAEGTGGKLGDIIAEAQKLQEMYGGGQSAPLGAPGDRLPTPDPERLARIAKLRASGAIDDAEYAKLRAEAGVPDPAAAPNPAETTMANGGAAIIAHRIYPGMRMRSSTRQLNRFLPLYQETVGVHPEDVYGVFPWGTRASQSGTESTSTEWDDYWIVYRNRPEYEPGREAYAAEVDKKGRWPQPVIAPGIGEAPVAAPTGGKLNVEKDRWPRKALVIKQTDAELADSLREKISKWGFEPEDSYGFCPNFPHSSIYFGWRKR
jgi:hypothetical protein